MPVTPAETNRLDRQAEVDFGVEGSITAKVREQSIGRAAEQAPIVLAKK